MNRTLYLSVFFILLYVFSGCNETEENNITTDRNFRQEMRSFVIGIASYARQSDSDFIVIPQNGHDIITLNGDPDGTVATEYVSAISGAGQEDFFYGYDEDNQSSPVEEREFLQGFLDIAESEGVEVLVTDYCWDHSKMDDSYTQNGNHGYISFAADSRELDIIPDYPSEPQNVNSRDIVTLSDASNFLYLLNPGEFTSRQDFFEAISQTNYDIIIMDSFFGDELLSSTEVTSLKTKAGGGKRIVIAYMSIGEAEDYRYYWKEEWTSDPPSWLAEENPEWRGNYKVRYWEQEWKSIIYGNDHAYLDRIVAAGFDGVYLDIIEAFEHFE